MKCNRERRTHSLHSFYSPFLSLAESRKNGSSQTHFCSVGARRACSSRARLVASLKKPTSKRLQAHVSALRHEPQQFTTQQAETEMESGQAVRQKEEKGKQTDSYVCAFSFILYVCFCLFCLYSSKQTKQEGKHK